MLHNSLKSHRSLLHSVICPRNLIGSFITGRHTWSDYDTTGQMGGGPTILWHHTMLTSPRCWSSRLHAEPTLCQSMRRLVLCSLMISQRRIALWVSRAAVPSHYLRPFSLCNFSHVTSHDMSHDPTWHHMTSHDLRCEAGAHWTLTRGQDVHFFLSHYQGTAREHASLGRYASEGEVNVGTDSKGGKVKGREEIQEKEFRDYRYYSEPSYCEALQLWWLSIPQERR